MCSVGPPGSQNFPKSRRLRKRAEYQNVYEQGARLRGACFAAFVRFTGEKQQGRIGMSISRRVGSSVVRSRVKRRLREIVRRHWDKLPDGCEVVFHAYPAIARTDFAELEQQIKRALDESSRLLRRGRGRTPQPGPSRPR